jgi:hypothetical protein
MQGNRTLKPSGSEKKMRQSIDRLLSDERGRALLTETLLNDRAFMESLVQRLVAVPEWRDMVARRLDADSAEGSARSSKPESPIASLYVCPMHSEVTSATPADCPKCGMRLERRPVNSR